MWRDATAKRSESGLDGLPGIQIKKRERGKHFLSAKVDRFLQFLSRVRKWKGQMWAVILAVYIYLCF